MLECDWCLNTCQQHYATIDSVTMNLKFKPAVAKGALRLTHALLSQRMECLRCKVWDSFVRQNLVSLLMLAQDRRSYLAARLHGELVSPDPLKSVISCAGGALRHEEIAYVSELRAQGT